MIHIITTGGTIEGFEYENEENRPEKVTMKIKDFFNTANVSFQYSIEEIFSKDSRFITQEDRKLLVKKIGSSTKERILITHGTITMIETAKFLGKQKLDKTIVLVGSFIIATEPKTDAPFNLGYAACAAQFLSRGVYIAMNGGIIGWKNVVKSASMNQFVKEN